MSAEALEARVRAVVVLDNVRLSSRRANGGQIDIPQVLDPGAAPRQEDLVLRTKGRETASVEPRRSNARRAVHAGRVQRCLLDLRR